MSDSEDDFASADEGDLEHATKQSKSAQKSTEASASGNVAVENQTKPSAEADVGKEIKEPSQGKKKGKASGKGGGGKVVTKTETKLSETAETTKKEESQKGAKGKGRKGKQKGASGGNKDVQKEKKSEQNVTDTQAKANVVVDDSADAKPSDSVGDESETVKPEVKDESKENIIKSEVKSSTSDIVVDKSPECVEGSQTNETETSNTSVEGSGKDAESEIVNTPTKDSGDTDTDSQNTPDDNASTIIKSPSSQSIIRPEPDHTNEQENVFDKLASAGKESKPSGWGWGWGASLLDVASTSVSTFTHQVGEGFNTVMDTVESTLNVPSPEELVQQSADTQADDDGDISDKKDAEEEEVEDSSETVQTATKSTVSEKPDEKGDKLPDDSEESAGATGNQPTEDESKSGGWFSSWGVSNITKMVENTSKHLVTGSLDVLETLGKKTFEALNERDPGLKKTRGFLHDRGDKPNLSAMLRDAKGQNEVRAQQEKESEEARKAHFGSLFDDFQGLAHLEALEILSNQSEKKVNTLLNALSAEAIASVKPQLLEIKQNFEIGDDDVDEDVVEHEFVQLITDLLAEMNVGTTPDKLRKTHETIRDSLKELCVSDESETKPQPKEIHQIAIRSLAELTAKSMEQFHKSGELMLLQKSEHADYVSNSKHLLSLTRCLCAEVGILSTKFTECLNKCADGQDTRVVNPLVTNVYLEASNSSSYIQDGFQLLLPVLQQAAIEKSQDEES